MPTIYVSREAAEALLDVRLHMAKMTGVMIDMSQAVLFLHKSWKGESPQVALKYPEKTVVITSKESNISKISNTVKPTQPVDDEYDRKRRLIRGL